ncbi:N-acetylmuramoyl-L-alanine amidase [Parabacteroides goldsteinii]|jgi:N-acetylmuramoyl-L-alanine amidase|uniref:N-acetylmuramoyl-L-alanine amidase n=1 Tax=Parabacteroides goldsteinii TaxID=328812 RepID=UPI0022E83377|nr:N-acetylmuramoyl-L-alanine amidase [Parabacteroides goldsteinii]
MKTLNLNGTGKDTGKLQGLKVLIDNGHGINTPGKRSPESMDVNMHLFEWEFNRDIARRVCETLIRNNVDCELIVKEVEDISLKERCNRVNAIATWVGKTNCIFVSIHANAGGGTGWEVFNYPNSISSRELASFFLAEVTARHDTDFPFKNRGMKTEKFAVLSGTICPAILTENLFMDTHEDFMFLCSDKGRAVIADIHVKAILKYLAK